MSFWNWISRADGGGDPAIAAYSPAFDAVIDIDPRILPSAIQAEAAITRTRSALRSIPGAARIRVRLREGPEPITAHIFPAGAGAERHGEPWQAIRSRVLATTRAANPEAVIANAPAPDPAGPAQKPAGRLTTAEWPNVPLIDVSPAQAAKTFGFAEAPLAAYSDALAELASLAQSVTARPRPVAKPPSTTEIDLTARLLGFVLPTEDRATATTAVHRFGSFAAVLAAPENELSRVPGLGPHSIAAIKLVHAAAIRLARAGVTGQPVLADPDRLSAYLAAALARERVEQFRILFLDESGMLKADEVQATGTVNHTPVYPREVVRRALELGAASIVLVHNHPSGDPTPSQDDLEMTQQIAEAAAALSIGLRDHIIVGNGRSLSFRDAGLLD